MRDAFRGFGGGNCPRVLPAIADLAGTLPTIELHGRLLPAGPERLPKTIYVRFVGGDSGRETCLDDIVLDQTRPTILATSGAGPESNSANPSVGTSSLRTRTIVLRVQAQDKTSGVRQMQVTTNKRQAGAWLRYKPKSKHKVIIGAHVFVRVRDGAGNLSVWHRVKR